MATCQTMVGLGYRLGGAARQRAVIPVGIPQFHVVGVTPLGTRPYDKKCCYRTAPHHSQAARAESEAGPTGSFPTPFEASPKHAEACEATGISHVYVHLHPHLHRYRIGCRAEPSEFYQDLECAQRPSWAHARARNAARTFCSSYRLGIAPERARRVKKR